MQEGAGKREKGRERQTQASAAKARSPIPQPWLWGWGEQGGLSLFPILTMGCPSKEQLQNTALSQAGDGPLCSGQSYLEGAAASGKQGCMLANPGLASPAGT